MINNDDLIINHLECEFKYCLSLNCFIDKISKRIDNFSFFFHFRKKIFSDILKEINQKKLDFLVEYQSDRNAINIINNLDLDSELKYFFWNRPIKLETTNLCVISKGFTFSEYNTVCLSFNIKLIENCTVELIIDQLSEIRKELKKNLAQYFKDALYLINKNFSCPYFSFSKVNYSKILKWMKTFEIYDFDFVKGNSSGGEILKSYFDVGNFNLPLELIGFLRMTRPGVWSSYKSEFQQNFWKGNLGNRNDEIWMIYIKHFIRLHPEREIRDSVKKFYNDTKLAFEIALHKIAFIENCNSLLADLKLSTLSNSSSTLQTIEQFSDLLPSKPDSNPNDFFTNLSVKFLDEYNYFDSLDQYKSQIQEIQSGVISYASFLLNKKVTILTVFTALLTICQFIIAIVDFQKASYQSYWYNYLFFFFESKYFLLSALFLLFLTIKIPRYQKYFFKYSCLKMKMTIQKVFKNY